MTTDEDRALLEAWRQGDAQAGNRLLKRHFDALYRFFRNKVDHGIEDLIQATFLACVRSRDKFRGDCSFRTYLFVIARHELYRSIRTRKRDRLVFDPDADSVHDLNPGPATIAAKKAEQKLLLRALRRIPVDLQVALELHYWEQLTTRELAEVLEVPQGTVKSRLRRAREALEGAMADLAETPQQLQSTVGDLEMWARSIKQQVGKGQGG